MSKTDVTRVIVKPGEPLPTGDTDWARVKAMTDEEVLAAALADPDAKPLGPEDLAKMRRVSSVKIGPALDRFIGTWTAEEEAELLEAIEVFERIDEDCEEKTEGSVGVEPV